MPLPQAFTLSMLASTLLEAVQEDARRFVAIKPSTLLIGSGFTSLALSMSRHPLW